MQVDAAGLVGVGVEDDRDLVIAYVHHVGVTAEAAGTGASLRPPSELPATGVSEC